MGLTFILILLAAGVLITGLVAVAAFALFAPAPNSRQPLSEHDVVDELARIHAEASREMDRISADALAKADRLIGNYKTHPNEPHGSSEI